MEVSELLARNPFNFVLLSSSKLNFFRIRSGVGFRNLSKNVIQDSFDSKADN